MLVDLNWKTISLSGYDGVIVGLLSGLAMTLSFWLGVGVLTGLLIGLSLFLGCRSTSPLTNGVLSGLVYNLLHLLMAFNLPRWLSIEDIPPILPTSSVVGLLGGLGIGTLNEIHLVETMHWQWRQFFKKIVPAGLLGLVVGGLLGGLFGTLRGELYRIVEFGSTFLVLGGLVGGLTGALVDAVRGDKASPNQGIKLSLKNGLAALLIGLLGFGPAIWLDSTEDSLQSNFMLASWLIILASVGLHRGGSAGVKHYSLRLVLWLTGATPSLSRFIPFLDHCAKLILLKKVGGGYMFIHRSLLEYFAGLPHQPQKAKDISAGSSS